MPEKGKPPNRGQESSLFSRMLDRNNRVFGEMGGRAMSSLTTSCIAPSALLLATCGQPADPNPVSRGLEDFSIQRSASPSDGNAAHVTAMAIRVFFDTCMKNPTDEGAVRTWLRNNGFHAAPPAFAASFLRGTPGTAWLRADPAPVAVPIAVVTRPEGSQCEVMAPVADPEAAAASFRRLIAGLEQPGLIVRKEHDENTAPNGGPGRFLLYRVGVPPIERGGFHFAMSARPPVAQGIALLMTAGRAAPR